MTVVMFRHLGSLTTATVQIIEHTNESPSSLTLKDESQEVREKYNRNGSLQLFRWARAMVNSEII